MDAGIVSAITSVITSLIVIIPTLLLVRWQAKKMAAEAAEHNANADAVSNSSVIDAANKISDTAMEWFAVMENRIKELDDKLSEHKRIIDQYEHDRKERSKTIESMRVKIKNLESENASMKSRITKYTIEAKKADGIIALQEEKIKKLEDRVSALEKEVEEYTFGINVLSEQLDSAGIRPRYVTKEQK